MSDARTDARRVEAQAKPLRDLLAENEQLREALERIRLYADVAWVGDEYATPEKALAQVAFDAADALAAVPEERPPDA